MSLSLFEIFIIAALAVYRITAMIHNEAGPADLFGRLRTRLGVKYDQYSNPYSTGWISEGVLCFYCLSIWVAFAVTAWLIVTALLGFSMVGIMLLFPFAMSGLAVYSKKAVG